MLENTQSIICDMDGVLWRGPQKLPGMNALFDFMFDAGMDFVLATNNSRSTPLDYCQKLAAMDVCGIKQSHIVTSGTATAEYLKRTYSAGTGIYVIGGDGLKQILINAGFALVEKDAEVVVCGVDFDLTYNRLEKATLLIRAGADFIGTNPDTSFPSPAGLVPGAGSILALLEAATDRKPTVIGKPERGMFEAALRQLGTSPAETLMIGDRIGTDIAGAQALGIPTALVMTGVETPDSLRKSAVQPDLVFADLPELISALRNLAVILASSDFRPSLT